MTLSGKTILVTRAQSQAQELAGLIAAQGGTPMIVPMIEILPPASWEACDRAIDRLHMYDGIIFTSTNAVDYFFQRMSERSASPQELRSKKIFTVGERTKEAVVTMGLRATAVPEKHTSADLGNMLAGEDLHGTSFLFPHGNLTNNTFSGNLKLLGASVDSIIVYQTRHPQPQQTEELRKKLLASAIDVVTFTSPSTIQNFSTLFRPDEISMMNDWTTIAVIGPTTAMAAKDIGLTVDILARESTMTGLVNSIIEHYKSSVQTPT